MPGTLILASASARRRKILAALGVAFEVVVPDVEEIVFPGEVRRSALENAARKSAWCRARHPGRHSLAADTLVEFRGRCLAKAGSAEEAVRFLRLLSGQTHTVYTAVALAAPFREPALFAAEAAVRFRALSDAEIRAYVAAVNPLDRAGAYDIDERGEALVAGYTGLRSTIMGLPDAPVAAWLRQEGLLPRSGAGIHPEEREGPRRGTMNPD